jgi:hypothetical protein
MTFQNYFYKESAGDMTSYDEKLLLDDNYPELSLKSITSAHFSLELEELEDDFESEYDENDWEEEESYESLNGEYDKNEEKPGSFQMQN